MLIGDDLRSGKTAAIDDAGMIQAIREDHILFSNQGRDGRQVSTEPGLEGYRFFNSLKCCQAPFQL